MPDRDCIVRIENRTSGKTVYYATDAMSGGYPYFTPNLHSAKAVPIGEADQIVRDFQGPNREDGSVNMLAHQAGDMCDAVRIAELEITIGRLTFVPEPTRQVVNVRAVDRRDQVEARRQQVAAAARAKLSREELAALKLA